MHHVAVADDVILSLEAELSGLARARLPVGRDVVRIGDGFGADETLLEVCVDDARGLRRARAACDGPGSRFFRTGCEKRDEPKERVAGTNETIESGLVEPEMQEEFFLLSMRQLRDFFLDARRDSHAACALATRLFLDARGVRI